MPSDRIEPPFISGTNAYAADDDTIVLALRVGDEWHEYRMGRAVAADTSAHLGLLADAGRTGEWESDAT